MTRYLVGVGNYTMCDDGIGPRIAEAVAERRLDQGFQVLDILDNGLNLLGYFTEDTERMLWVDCVDVGRKPGEWLLFSPEDVESRKRLSARTTHEGDLLQVLELARQLGYPIPSIRILGIQPGKVAQGLELSPALQERFEEYINVAVGMIQG